jgi:hypothetical protein
MPKTLTEADWSRFKLDYMARKGSLRELAAQHGVSFHTAAKRCRRENWCGRATAFEAELATRAATAAMATATMTAMEQGRQLGLDASSLITRTLSLTDRFLNQIESKLAAGQLSVAELHHLSATFRDTVGIGRQGLGLDADQGPRVLVYRGAGDPPFAKVLDVPSCAVQ